MKRKGLVVWMIVTGVLAVSIPLSAEESKQGGMPPAKVVVAGVKSGMIAPTAEFVGTVMYAEVSDVASEVSGKVEEVLFEEGDQVKRGQILVKASSDVLEKTLESTQASLGQALADLEKAKLDLSRIEALYREESVAEQVYDETRFRVTALEKKAEALNADLARLRIELEKKDIRAPFNGVVIKKSANRGEWLAPGTAVGRVANTGTVDIMVDVPEGSVPFVSPGMAVEGRAGGVTVKGKVIAVIPEGNVATRTFPVKIRVRNPGSLIAGMEARVSLPSSGKRKVLLVPRDAVIPQFGKQVVFSVAESRSQMIPVMVVGYDGLDAGVAGEGLEEGMKVVVKGNERLRDGQPVIVQ